ncbi:amidase domain-containing protein [Hazenella sp. IB182353]|uniref:amidase domain-containing protein n=1 Tax=Polycladospora coralii TaxID=2771432 RepID=UPI001745F0E5|nr:amidase domain-containing protein [Polycladospora coralii]MBS7530036.1 amidase domain-containing protein [Polycladospora coralii]
MKKMSLASLVIASVVLVAGCGQGATSEGSSDATTKPKKEVAADTVQVDIMDGMIDEIPTEATSDLTASMPQDGEKGEVDPELSKKVDYYEVPKTSEKPKVSKEVEKIIKKEATENKLNLDGFDVNNKESRLAVQIALSNLNEYSSEEQKMIVKLAEEIDIYENKSKNDYIKVIDNKIKNGIVLSDDEKALLDGLVPIDAGTELENDKGTTDGGTTDGGTTDGGTTDGGTTDGGTTDGGTTDGDTTDGGTTDGGTTDGGTTDGGTTDGGTTDGGTTDGGTTDGGTTDGGTTDGGTTDGEYDGKAAANYAKTWWDKRNNEQYPYYSKVSGGCYDCWPDCTNFVSQAIKAGGIEDRSESGLWWYYNDTKPAYAWGLANSFYKHFKQRADEIKKVKNLEIGDVVNFDFTGDGDIDHTVIVTKKDRWGNIYVTQHTSDHKNRPISQLFVSSKTKAYAWDMSTANQR